MKNNALLIITLAFVLMLAPGGMAQEEAVKTLLDPLQLFHKPAGDISHGLSNEEFVRQLYRDILKREPDAAGFAGWVNALNSGSISRAKVMQDFVNSEENARSGGNPPSSVNPAPSGPGPTIPDIRKPAADPAMGGSNEEFVRGLYRTILQREPDARGMKGWVDALNQGTMSREQVVGGFTNSIERRNQMGTATGAEGDSPRTSLDDLLGGGDPVVTGGDATGGENKSKRFDFGPRPTGGLEFETAGIVHQDKPTINGDGEYIFLTLRGEGFRRLLLIHASGNGRAVRYGLNCKEIDTLRMEVASDHLPDWHKWAVKWGGGKISVYLDGRQLGEERFSGIPSYCIVGGNENAKRNFLGTWRNFKVY